MRSIRFSPAPSEAAARLRVGLGLVASLSMRAVTTVLLAGAVNVAAQTNDYDDNDNRLIDIRSLAQLNAMRWDLDGNGTATMTNAADYSAAFPSPATNMGCPAAGCIGYELRAHLDFDTDGDGDVDGNDPNSYANFLGVGQFAATFRGNGYTISNLTINTTNATTTGMFNELTSAARVRGVGLIRPNVTGNRIAANGTGSLVGLNNGTVIGCYSIGGTVTHDRGDGIIGGLVGRNSNLVRTSYSSTTTNNANRNNTWRGGLVGTNNNATIRNSYAVGSTLGSNVGNRRRGGLTANSHQGTIANSYWDNTIVNAAGLNVSATLGKTTSQLQTPSAYTGIYAAWDDTDGDAWDFGTTMEYPVLKLDGHDPELQRPGPRVSATTLMLNEGGAKGSYGVYLSHQPSGAVTVTVSGASGAVTVDTDSATGDQNTLTFTTMNWRTSQAVTVSAGQDDNGADEMLGLFHAGTGGNYYGGVPSVASPGVLVTVDDDEVSALLIDANPATTTVDEPGPLALNEQSGHADKAKEYTVRLSLEPTGPVTVDVVSDDRAVAVDTDMTPQTLTLTFSTTNFATPQTVTATAAEDDDAADESVTISHSASGGGFAGVSADLRAETTDDDTPALVVDASSLTGSGLAEGASATYTVRLDKEPTGGRVLVSVSAQGAFRWMRTGSRPAGSRRCRSTLRTGTFRRRCRFAPCRTPTGLRRRRPCAIRRPARTTVA